MGHETCKIIKIENEIDGEYYAFATFTPSSTGDPIEMGHISLDLTNGSETFWHGEGLEGQGTALAPDDLMHLALKALTASNVPSHNLIKYHWNIKEEATHLSMIVPTDDGRTERVRIALEKCTGATIRVMNLLQKMSDTLSVMQQAKAKFDQQLIILEEEAKEGKKLLEKYVDKKGKNQERVNGTFAELLNHTTGFRHTQEAEAHDQNQQLEEESAEMQFQGESESSESSGSDREEERESEEPQSDADHDDY